MAASAASFAVRVVLTALVGSCCVVARAQIAQEPFHGTGCTAPITATLSVSAPGLSDDALLVVAGYTPGTWEGHVKAYDARHRLAEGGSEALPAWTASFPSPTERNIYTASSPTTGVPFEWCSLSDEQRRALEPEHAVYACPALAPPIVAYLRGDTTQEVRQGGSFRDRPTTVLGDVVNSTPLYSHARDHGYQLAPAASFSSSGAMGHGLYREHVAAKKSSRLPTLMFGANDGMFHVLDARLGVPTSGREVFAYVPRAAFAVLRSLAGTTYSHRYSVDGPVVEGDVWTGSHWKTVAIGTTGAGPPGIFALDVTAPGPAMDARNVMWDITAADHPSAAVRSTLGRTIGAGVIGSVRLDADGVAQTEPNGAWAYIVGNGYESGSDTAALLVLNAMDGSLIRVLDTRTGSANARNGLGAVTPVYDANRNIVLIYAGDKLGNLWKFDLRSANPVEWKVFNEQPAGVPAPLFVASRGGTTRPIHQAPRVMPHALGGLTVAIGTGKYFEIGDPGSRDDQGIFVLRDMGDVSPLAFDDLPLVRTDEYTNGAGVYRRLYGSDLAIHDLRKGFWVRLRPLAYAESGERVIAPLALDAGVLVVSTFAPGQTGDGCATAGRSYLYRIDLAGGLARGSFAGESGKTVARAVDGAPIGFVSLHLPARPSAQRVDTMSASELDAMLERPLYRLAPDGTLIHRANPGSCLHAGAHLDGSVVRIETRCAGVLPLRAWRPMK